MTGTLGSVLLWVSFFAASAYGHVALKFAVDARAGQLTRAMLSPLAVSAYVAWGASALLWAVTLSRHSLGHANAISSLRYVILAGCAIVCFGEPLTLKRVAGSLLVAAGIWMVT